MRVAAAGRPLRRRRPGAHPPRAAARSAGTAAGLGGGACSALSGRRRGRRRRRPPRLPSSGRNRSAALGTRSTSVNHRDLDRDVGGHLRPQLEVRVADLDDDRVGDDVLVDRGVEPDLGDRAPELLLGVGVDREARHLAGRDPADVGLVDVGLDLHLGQVLGDGEQGRRLERGGHGLADVVLARHHHPVDGRGDPGVPRGWSRTAARAARACSAIATAASELALAVS